MFKRLINTIKCWAYGALIDTIYLSKHKNTILGTDAYIIGVYIVCIPNGRYKLIGKAKNIGSIEIKNSKSFATKLGASEYYVLHKPKLAGLLKKSYKNGTLIGYKRGSSVFG